jgi:SRSO17 transposase
LIDESGVVKQGDHSVGVAPQYCGSVGKVANSQVGVYLGYVSRKGYSMISGRLFMPKQWLDAEHADKREACGVPEDLAFKTKPQISLDLLQEMQQRGDLPFQWVAADELYGDSPAFRDGVAAMGKWCAPLVGAGETSHQVAVAHADQQTATCRLLGRTHPEKELDTCYDQRRQQGTVGV